MLQKTKCEAKLYQLNQYNDGWDGKMHGLVAEAKSAEPILLGNQGSFLLTKPPAHSHLSAHVVLYTERLSFPTFY